MKAFAHHLVDWLEDRAGVVSLLHETLYESVPGGARWRYVWGSTLTIAFLTQIITGTFLWVAYSPSTQTAWESVFYIQFQMPGGWLLRGLHHYMAHAMVILLGLHFAQVVWDGAYRAPRELNFVVGLVLMLIVLGLALTGYLLPWDQKGYWATSVGTNLASQAPMIGPELKKIAIGGSDYGHYTLTRFFALHAGILPGFMIIFITAHVTLFRRHGLHAKQPPAGPDAMFWPDQVLKDSVAALGVLVVVLGFAIFGGGAELTAPADGANPYNAARPEWYFLFLFQFLKWFPGELEIWGAFIIPGIIVVVLFLMPWIGRSRSGHLFNVTLMLIILGGIALLTGQAMWDDNYAKWHERTEANAEEYDASRTFLDAEAGAEHTAERVIALAQEEKIPPTGALTLVANDPYLQGPLLFKNHCAGCHSHVDRTRETVAAHTFDNEQASAPNLAGVGTSEWVAAILDPKKIVDRDHFGYLGSPIAEGTMVDWVQSTVPVLDPEQIKLVTVALAAESGRAGYRATDPGVDAEKIAVGMQLIKEEIGCTDCHKFHEIDNEGGAPDLTGYMSRAWLIEFIRNPGSERFYGENNDRMPAFAPHENPALNQLDEKSLGLIVDWLRDEWVVPGEEINPEPAQ